ncbi:MAG: cytochrome P450 [Vicinamibacterales bacterium]
MNELAAAVRPPEQRAGRAGSAYRSLLELRRGHTDPIAFLRQFAGDGPIVEFPFPGQRAFLLNDPETIQDVLITNQDRFRKPPALDRATRLLGRGLLTADQSIHAARRRAMLPTFHAHRMNRYADAIVTHAARRRDGWRDGQTLDVVDEMTTLTLGVIGDVFFGADLQPLAPELRGLLANAIGGLDPLVALVAPQRHLRHVRVRLQAIVQGFIDARLASTKEHDDLLDLLLQAQGPEATPLQLQDDLLTMLLAGHDTIGHALMWTWTWLAHEGRPAEASLHAEIGAVLGDRSAAMEDVPRLAYTRAVLSESLRLTPPAWIIARTAIEGHAVGGVTVPAGALVVVSPYLLHRDPRFFENPLMFNPGRWLSSEAAERPRLAFLPFGAGRRSCIGESFAWLEGVLALATIAQRWTLRPLGERQGIDPRITLRPAGPVMMRAVHN